MSFASKYRKVKLWIHTGAFTFALAGCVESYDIPVSNADVHFLVVDGFINTDNGKVDVGLFRAVGISEKNIPFELQAVVGLEDVDGNRYMLTELDSGKYQGIAPSLEAGKQYRLYIKTADEKEYRSAYITLKSTPEIKEVSWKALADGTQIVVDTEDEDNATRYYRWTFVETWEYHSRYTSWFMLGPDIDSIQGDEIVPRGRDDMINVCYSTLPSTLIYTTTTSGLTEDKVNDFELPFLPKGTEKLGYGYSILVRQYAISRETYEYLEKLKKTSQDLNGLYAPQPSKVTGNVFNIADPSEVVLGYFDAGQMVEKRLFLTPQDLPAHLRTLNPDNTICYLDTLRGELAQGYVLIDLLTDDEGNPAGFSYTKEACGDCRVKGGVTVKPDFWP